VGTGGAGNTTMHNLLKKQDIVFNRLGNPDGLKHLLHPKKAKNVDRALFIYSDNVIRGIYSHYRRWSTPNAHFKNFNCTVPLKFEDLITETDKQKKDLTGILQQIENWQQAEFPVLFVNFSCINEQKTRDTIRQFLNNKNIKLPTLDMKRLTKYDSIIYSKVTPEFINLYKLPENLHLKRVK